LKWIIGERWMNSTLLVDVFGDFGWMDG